MSTSEEALEWETEALRILKLARAVNSMQIVKLLRAEKVSLDDLADVCEQYYHDYPCLFYARVRDGLL